MGNSLGDLTGSEAVPSHRPQPAIRRMQPQRKRISSTDQGELLATLDPLSFTCWLLHQPSLFRSVPVSLHITYLPRLVKPKLDTLSHFNALKY